MGEEVVSGFRVSEGRKKVWCVQLKLAREVRRVCEKHNIQYFLIWGTLLGAVRHGGFIPWDDDLDIGFLREDYERLCQIIESEIESPLFFQNALTDRRCFIGYSRLRDSSTTGIILSDNYVEYNNGIFIDLYPLDKIPNNRIIRKFQYIARDWLTAKLIEHCRDKDVGDKYEKRFALYKRLCSLGEYIKSDEVGLLYHKLLINNYHFKKTWVDEVVDIDFCLESFKCPRDYKKVLSSVYGDYLKLPPKSQRGNWHKGMIVYNTEIPYKEFMKNKGKYAPEKI